MTTLSTHVLDAARGLPAAGVDVELRGPDGGPVAGLLERAATDDDGRVRFETTLTAGTHRLVLATGAWFGAAGRETFFPEVVLAFDVDAGRPHLHVALLLSPYAYTTYQGS